MRITASGGLDEYGIADLLAAGAPIDVFAVGTRVGVAADAPYLDAAYKLVAYDGRPMMKLSAGKATAPGAKQVFRGPGSRDTLALRKEPGPPESEPLLRRVMTGGQRLRGACTLAEARACLEADLAALPAPARRITDPLAPTARQSSRLVALTRDVTQQIEWKLRSADAAASLLPRHGG